ncbi:MAG: hypothetical protein ACI4RJ_01960 [Alphaproteobacteria bacterium]
MNSIKKLVDDMMKMRFYTLQKGRSMIEIIGVLAIIGVLSVVSVVLLRKAFIKHEANNIIEDVKMAGFIVVDELFSSLTDREEGISLKNIFTQKTSYEIRAFPETESSFELTIQNVSYNICQEVKNRETKWIEEIRINDMLDACQETQPNEMRFFLNTSFTKPETLLEGECRTNRDCPTSKPYCSNDGFCQKCVFDNHCSEDTPYCRGGKCVECPQANKTYQKCVSCPAINAYDMGITKESCHDGCGENFFYSKTQECVGCNANISNSYVITTVEECNRCPNRYYNETEQKCYFCPPDKRVTEDKSDCLPIACSNDSDCADVDGFNYCRGGKCVECPQANKTYQKCVSCPAINAYDMGITKESCHDGCGENFFYSKTQECVGCNANISNSYVITTVEECNRCPNRYYNETEQKCLLCTGTVSPDGLHCQ